MTNKPGVIAGSLAGAFVCLGVGFGVGRASVKPQIKTIIQRVASAPVVKIKTERVPVVVYQASPEPAHFVSPPTTPIAAAPSLQETIPPPVIQAETARRPPAFISYPASPPPASVSPADDSTGMGETLEHAHNPNDPAYQNVSGSDGGSGTIDNSGVTGGQTQYVNGYMRHNANGTTSYVGGYYRSPGGGGFHGAGLGRGFGGHR